MIKTGDRVKFLNDVGGGVVTGFIGKNMVKVENEEGFEIPYPVNLLICVDDPALNARAVSGAKSEAKMEEGKRREKEEEVIPSVRMIKGKDAPDFYFCFVPENEKNPVGGAIDLFLVNDSNYTLVYRYAHHREETYTTVQYGTLAANSRIELESLGLNDLNNLPGYCFQLIYFRDGDKDLNLPVTKIFKINPVKFYKERSYYSNAFFSNDAMVLKISEDLLNTEIDKLTAEDFKKVVKKKEQQEPEKSPVRVADPEVIEVDLHIHALIDDSKGLSNKEILDLQLEKVEREMRAAVQSGSKRIVFIHGVGQGVLKQEITRFLQKKFPTYAFHDASFREYGYGATMVLLKRK